MGDLFSREDCFTAPISPLSSQRETGIAFSESPQETLEDSATKSTGQGCSDPSDVKTGPTCRPHRCSTLGRNNPPPPFRPKVFFHSAVILITPVKFSSAIALSASGFPRTCSLGMAASTRHFLHFVPLHRKSATCSDTPRG
uniref:Putative ovule protein n=1 Tax=Solanum chacoense TaxID=4108 RepID=A0A0V0HEU8_SOLCH